MAERDEAKRDHALRHLRVEDLVEVVATAEVAMRAHSAGLDHLDGVLGGVGSPDSSIDDMDWGDATVGNTGTHLSEALGEWAAAVAGSSSLTDFAARTASLVAHPGIGTGGALLIEFAQGFVEVCRNVDSMDAERLAMAIEVGAEHMRLVARPSRAATMIDVALAVAEAALAGADRGVDLAEMVLEAAEAGLDALEQTPLQSPELAAAGVVDAGGAGFLVVVDTLVAVVHGDDPEVPQWEFAEDIDPDGERAATERYRYVISLRLAGAADVADLLRRAWMSLGDEVHVSPTGDADAAGGTVVVGSVVVGSVHSDDIGAVIEAAISLGRPSRIAVRDNRA